MSRGVQDRSQFSVMLPTIAFLNSVERRGSLDYLFLLMMAGISEHPTHQMSTCQR